jgi:phage terminase Nu1 subunit (DNA packaging protein)
MNNKIIINAKELAEWFEVSEKYISELVIKQGMPKISFNQFDLFVCVKWWFNYQRQICDNEKDKLKSEKASDLNQRKSAEEKDLRILEKKKVLVNTYYVKELFSTFANMIKTKLEAIPNLIAENFNGDLMNEVRDIAEKEIYKIRNEIADSKLTIDDDTN